MTPERFRELLLDHAYGLLDGADEAAMQQYVESHADAQAELARVQGLIARAAKIEFPNVTFQPPASAVKSSSPVVPSSRSVARPGQRTMPGIGMQWIVVASILLVGGALAFPAFSHFSRYFYRKSEAESLFAQARSAEESHRQLVAKRQAELDDARKKREAIKDELVRIETDRVEKLNQAEEQERNKQLVMTVTGPSAIQSGAPNEFMISTKYRNDQIAAANLGIRIRDQNRNVIFEEKQVTSLGQHRFVMPADVPYKPNTRLSIEVSAQDAGGRSRSELTEELTWAAPRFVTHLTTDKPMYQPGQVVYFRSLTLNRASMQPPEEDFVLEYSIMSPKGQKLWSTNGETRLRSQAGGRDARALMGPDQKPIHGIGAGQYQLPESIDGGEFTLVVREMRDRFPVEKRKFLVNKYKPDRLFKELDFTRKTYGPGAEVIANCKVSTEAGPVANKEVAAVQVNVDGQEVPAQALGKTDSNGWVRVRCVLPVTIDRGVASMTVVFTDGGARESIQKPIPIAMKKLFVEFYPEGGQIVAGVPNRVYFQVRNTLDKPAELKGKIVNKAGVEVADVATLNDDLQPGANQGMGVFSFTPSANESYTLRIEQPAGIESVYTLPAAQTGGVAMQAPTGVTGGDEPIRLVLHTPGRSAQLFVGAYVRGRMLASQRVTTKSDAATLVELQGDSPVGGVVRVTVFEDQAGSGERRTLTPKAERLVFRKTANKLDFQVQTDKSRYSPGDSVKIRVSATNESGQPAPAIAYMAVVNQSIITMADEKVARTLPTHVALNGEVRRSDELEFADFLLTDHPVAAKALDLLLGVQGWRRFAEQNVRPAKQGEGDDDVDRLLVMTGQNTVREVVTLNYVREQIESKYAPKRKELEEKFESAVIAQQEVLTDQQFPQELQRQQTAAQASRRQYESALAALAPFETTNRQIRMAMIPLLGLVCFGVILLGVVQLTRGGIKQRAGQLIVGAAFVCGCLIALAGVSIVELQSSSNRGGKNVASMDMPKRGQPMEHAAMDMAPNVKPGDAEMIRPNAAAPEMAEDPRRPVPPPGPPQLPGGPGKPGPKMAPEQKKPADFGRGADPKDMAKDKKFDLAPTKGGKPLVDDQFAKLPEADRQMNRRNLDGVMKGEKEALRKGDAKAMERGDVAGEVRKEMQKVRDEVAMRAVGGGFGGGGGPPGIPGAALPRPGGPGFDQPAVTAAPFVIREYAHVVERSANGVREDRCETVYWHPVLIVPTDKTTEVQFQLSDEVTRYRVLIAGHAVDGRLGSFERQIESRKPFSLEAKLPTEITANDKVDVPVVITNDTDSPRNVVIHVAPTNLELRQGANDSNAQLQPNSRSRRIYRLQSTVPEGEASVRMEGSSEPFAADTVIRRIPVVPEGYPVNEAFSDLLEKGVTHEIKLPEDYVRGTLKLRAQIFPSTLADLQKGLEGLLREPNGCFEQTSTTNYPNALILNYLKSSDQGNPDAERRARELLQRGYQRLTSFECEKRSGGREGYEWFGGQAPPHEALTAYGLMQFNDMAGVFDVDKQMVARTREYLLSRRTGDGTFQRNTRALDTFGRAPQHITDAYIVWALTETGNDNLDKEIDRLLIDHAKSTDPYFLSLMGNALLNCGGERRAKGLELLKVVRDKQTADGGLDGAETSITHSGGRELRIETTALAVLGWLKANSPADFAVPLDKAVKWITQQRGGYGGFGSTQSTILALKALIQHTLANKKPAEGGHLTLFVNGSVVERRFFDAGEQGEIFIDVKDPERLLKPGRNEVRLVLSTKRPYPYTLGWRYQTLTPASADKCPVRLTTSLNETQVKEGDGVRLTATVENLGGAGKGKPMTMAIIGLPAGLKVPEDMKQLKELALLRRTGANGEFESGPISFFEIRGRELILYWRDLKPEAKIDINIDLIAEIPGEYRGPASRAYLYYNADHKHWVKPLEIKIAAVEAAPE